MSFWTMKAIRKQCVANLKHKDDGLFIKRRSKWNLDMALSIKFSSYNTDCEPKEVLEKVRKFSKKADSVKLGKLRPNQKRGPKNQWLYQGWLNFFGVGDCRRARKLIESNKKRYRGMQVVKADRIRCLCADQKKKIVFLPKFRLKAKKKVPKMYYILGKTLLVYNDSSFANDCFYCFLEDVLLLG